MYQLWDSGACFAGNLNRDMIEVTGLDWVSLGTSIWGVTLKLKEGSWYLLWGDC